MHVFSTIVENNSAIQRRAAEPQSNSAKRLECVPACRRFRITPRERKREQAPAPYTHLQSQRDCVLQPRVARHELPWVLIRKAPSTPRGLRRCSPRPNLARLERHNSFGVEVPTRLLPRVARSEPDWPSSQPWALRRNPFGILHWPTPPKIRVKRRASSTLHTLREATATWKIVETRNAPGCTYFPR